ncbi:hypothetical protein Tcan_03371 [Toxocara canis]|uniref:Uncharacterized protein n=2 Tax=Toxocara canis TaxID=6265 RepID=A0A0B2VBE9_TOXCA|nr:hypothetical protein Tcan_03371 [Toxocara canis]VDM42671.1 unnamed protein product [Toxocara canis]
MALIYASAVNKRINHHQSSQKSRKKSVEHHMTHCQQPAAVLHLRQRSSDDARNTFTVEEALTQSGSHEMTPQRKRSTSQHSMPCSCTPPTGSSTIEPESKPVVKSHKPIQRSRTSCGDLTRRVDGGLLRKSSQPTGTIPEAPIRKPGSKYDLRRSVIKRRVEYDYNESGASRSHSPTPEFKDRHPSLRRDSLSLDAEEWRVQMDLAIEEETGVTGDSGKPGAFQRMKRKFSKWKLSRADEKDDR